MTAETIEMPPEAEPARRDVPDDSGALVTGHGRGDPRSAAAALLLDHLYRNNLVWKYGHYRPPSYRSDGRTS